MTASIGPQGEEGPQVGRGWSELPVDRPPCRAQQEYGRSNPATRACGEPTKASVTVPKIVTARVTRTRAACPLPGAQETSTAPSRGMASWSQSDPKPTIVLFVAYSGHR